MDTLYKVLEEEIKQREEKLNKPVTSSVLNAINSCSKKLKYAKTVEEIDSILKLYHVDKNYIGRYISWDAADKFEKYIEELKKDKQ
jgi:hypothetical protein